MTLLQEQEQLVDDLKEIEDKLYNLSNEHANADEIGDAWVIIYELLQKEKSKENEMRKNTRS